MKRTFIEKEFEALHGYYFNSAYFGPIPRRALEKGHQALQRSANPVNMPYEEWRSLPDQIRKKAGEVFGINSELVAVSTSTSELISHIANGYPWKKGDVVVSYKEEYPSDILPWMKLKSRYGFELTLLDDRFFLNPFANLDLLPANTKILNISHVRFDTGVKVPILEIANICRERGILFVCDMTQSLGNCPISAAEMGAPDVAIFSTYKWLLSSYGQALGVFTEEALALLDHTHVSWLTNPNTYKNELLNYSIETMPGARKFDRGQPGHLVECHTFLGALDFFDDVGLKHITAHNQELTTMFLENFPSQKFDWLGHQDFRSSIVCLKSKGGLDSEKIKETLLAKKIDASVRSGNLRLSFHIFNDREQIEYLLRTLHSL